MKFTLDEETIAEALMEWADTRIRVRSGECVKSVVLGRTDDGKIVATVVLEDYEP